MHGARARWRGVTGARPAKGLDPPVALRTARPFSVTTTSPSSLKDAVDERKVARRGVRRASPRIDTPTFCDHGAVASSTGGVRSLRTRLYSLAFVDEFVPFAVLFTLWFDDNGVGVAQLSIVFVMWATAVLVLEIPSGILADRVDRRRLLATAFVLRAVGITVWLIEPSLTGLVIGGALWAIHEAVASGAWEALIHDELEGVGAERDYGVVIARVGQFSNGGTAAAALVSTPLLGLGLDLAALGWLTAAMHAVSLAIVLSLPDVRWVVDRSRRAAGDDGATTMSTRSVFRLLGQRSVGIAVLVGAFIGGLAIIDEYVPLLARERGLDDTWIPLVFLSVWIGLLVGGEIAARQPTIGPSLLAVLVAIGSVGTAVALVTDTIWTLPLMAIAYAAIELTWVAADARLQARVPAHIRATVTSVREFGVGGVAAIALAAIGVMADGDDPTPGLLPVAAALGAVSLLVARLPRRLAAPAASQPAHD